MKLTLVVVVLWHSLTVLRKKLRQGQAPNSGRRHQLEIVHENGSAPRIFNRLLTLEAYSYDASTSS